MNAALRNREGVARRLATNHERDATDVALRRRSESFHAVWRRLLRRERLELDDLLADAENIVRAELDRLIADELAIHAVERHFVFDGDLRTLRFERRMTRREV